MKKLFLPLLLFVVFACSPGNPAESEKSNAEPAAEEEVEIAIGSSEGLELDRLNLPDGFKVDLFGRAKQARSMAMSPGGTLFIGSRSTTGNVQALRDTDGDNKADERYTLARGLNMPNGVAFKDGDLYVAEVSKLWKFENIEANLDNPGEPVLIYDDLPTERHHGWKYIAFGPDGKLYVPVGAPCNICESDEIYTSILRMNADGSDREIYVTGVRNTVGFTWHPDTKDLWFTDNGRDWLGDDSPSCELNRATEQGQHFGYPYCHAGTVVDPGIDDDKQEFKKQPTCDGYVAPAQNLGPHVAPLGLKFYTASMFPTEYQGKILIAEHGSWNRTPEAGHTGHQLTMVGESNGVGTSYEPFITGWLNEETNQAWGRPVDILVMDDGSILVSDDLSGTIYRIRYES